MSMYEDFIYTNAQVSSKLNVYQIFEPIILMLFKTNAWIVYSSLNITADASADA